MSFKHNSRARALLLSAGLGLTCAATAAAQAAPAPGAPADPTRSPLWCRHIILLYAHASGAYMDSWTDETLDCLTAYRDREGVRRDFLFDGFLILGFSCKEGKHLIDLSHRKPAAQSDWEMALKNHLIIASRLSQSFDRTRQALGQPDRKANVILSLPYPDRRQNSFGRAGGDRDLDFSGEQDRLAAMKWFVDEAQRKWNELAAKGSLGSLRLAALYWAREGIGDDDVKLVSETSVHVHGKGLLLHWIPCFNGAREDWRELGLDCVTQQINYQNPQKPGRTLDIFDSKTAVVDALGMHGVEMTVTARRSRLNPRIWSWHQVYLANLEAAVRHDWLRQPATTYFHGLELAKIAADAEKRVFYEKLHRWIRGELTQTDLDELAAVVLAEVKAQGFIDDAAYAKIASGGTVLEKLQLLEEPKLEKLRQEEAARLAPYTQSSGNLLPNGSFEQGAEHWTKLPATMTRTKEEAHDGQWSLRVELEPDPKRGDAIRTHIRSAKVPVKPGRMVRLRAWVKLPKDLGHTSRGLMIRTLSFRNGKQAGNRVSYGVSQARATTGWTPLTMHVATDDPPCDEILGQICMCGDGVAYVDAVELVVLSKPEPPQAAE